MDRRNFIKKIGAGSLVAGTVMAGWPRKNG